MKNACNRLHLGGSLLAVEGEGSIKLVQHLVSGQWPVNTCWMRVQKDKKVIFFFMVALACYLVRYR